MQYQQKQIEFNAVVDDCINYVQLLSANGCKGFDCSQDILKMVTQWGRKKRKQPDALEFIKSDLGDCTRCNLSKVRKNIVFGSGNPHARIVFVGDGPGFEEDQQGQPFVGPAGQLLTKIIQAIKLTRKDVYLCYVIKCRPPDDRNPLHGEIEACQPFLHRQINAIKPEFIVALGTAAAQTLLNTSISISRLRGQLHNVKDVKVLPTYSPAHLLRYPEKKRDVWEDMKLLIRICRL